jgi:hypothetical protein
MTPLPFPLSLLLPNVNRFALPHLLPSGAAWLQAQNNGVNGPWTETYKMVLQNSPFIFINGVSVLLW